MSTGIAGDDCCGGCSMGTNVSQNEVFTQSVPSSLPDSTYNPWLGGKAGEGVVAELHGPFYTANYRGVVFTYNRTGITIPIVATTLISVFSLWNPTASGKNAEIIAFDFGTVSATTVVDTVGLYYSAGTQATSGTFTTAGTALSSQIGNTSVAAALVPYSAYTHVAGVARHSILGTFGATTTTAANVFRYTPGGALIIPPGTVVSLAMSTAASTSSGVDAGVTWAEFPI
jgi:hypothetical protein